MPARAHGRASAELRRQADAAPDAPGVYLWKAADGTVLYVGKAKSLRKRVKQYVLGQDARETVPLIMAEAATLDWLVTASEVESLILEANLIKEHDPRYNVLYRDDKSYPFIAITLPDPFPAIKHTREKHRDGVRYFGPYTDSRAAHETIETVRRIHPICRAICAEWKRLTARGGAPLGRPCFDRHVGKGPGPCVGAISRDEYAENVAGAIAFLEGRQRDALAGLEREMYAASADLDYERAARLRKSIEAVRAVLERQRIVSARDIDADVVGIWREETVAGVQVLVVRGGRVVLGNEIVLDKGLDVPVAELVEGFLVRYYSEASHVPREVLLPALPDDPGPVEEWLSRLRGARVRVRVPERGEKRALLEMAETNARHTLARFIHRTRYDEQRTNDALAQLESALALPAPPMRIEAFDISTLHGRHSVGSMVVFTGGRADPAAYRRFRVRAETPEADDFAMMREVLARRFARGAAGDPKFGKRPDLVIVDGGKGQLSSAVQAMAEIGVSVPVAALAKREEELHLPGWDAPVVLPNGSPSLYLVKRVRDEAHRFAVEYHRELRAKAMTAGVLDTVPGIGPKRAKALLKAFGSVKRMRAASADDLAAVPGMTQGAAEDLAAALRAGE